MFEIPTVSGDTVRVDRMEADMMPGAIITVKRQPDMVAGAVVLRIDGYHNGKLASCRLNPIILSSVSPATGQPFGEAPCRAFRFS